MNTSQGVLAIAALVALFLQLGLFLLGMALVSQGRSVNVPLWPLLVAGALAIAAVLV